MHRTLLPHIEAWLFRQKVIVLYGARQVGKTTLSKMILEKHGRLQDYYLCERFEVREILQTANPERIKSFFGNAQIIVLDEAQSIQNIGQILKLLHDTFPDLQIIATGSASFDLANKINEPLTGRALQFMLYPLSLQELEPHFNRVDIKENLATHLIYGSYPGFLGLPLAEKKLLLNNLTEQYLHKDLLMFETLQNSEKILRLLKLLALQLGSEVSIHELAMQLGISRATVERFLDVLQKMFIIIKVGSFSRNLRKELSKKAKYYFCDLGIRNSLLNHFSPIETRSDIGALWENYGVMERIKFWHNQNERINYYFWRTHDQQEIDYLEEKDGSLIGFEFKWQAPRHFTPPKIFLETYPQARVSLISPMQLFDLIETV
jgi:predicted AAA+ superfamily ATPase